MKICILGNSHAASLKTGWDQISSNYPQIKLTFFAARGNSLSGLESKLNILVAINPDLENSLMYTSGGIKQIHLNQYDLFLIYGLGFRIPKLDKRLPISTLNLLFSDINSNCLSINLAKKIRNIVSVPIYIGHAPLEAHENELSSKDTSNILIYEDVVKKMSLSINVSNTTLIGQPLLTRNEEYKTKREFSKGSTRLDVGDKLSGQLHPNDDLVHMNGKFGALWLEDFFKRVLVF